MDLKELARKQSEILGLKQQQQKETHAYQQFLDRAMASVRSLTEVLNSHPVMQGLKFENMREHNGWQRVRTVGFKYSMQVYPHQCGTRLKVSETAGEFKRRYYESEPLDGPRPVVALLVKFQRDDVSWDEFQPYMKQCGLTEAMGGGWLSRKKTLSRRCGDRRYLWHSEEDLEKVVKAFAAFIAGESVAESEFTMTEVSEKQWHSS